MGLEYKGFQETVDYWLKQKKNELLLDVLFISKEGKAMV